jgi:hypothetical protein
MRSTRNTENSATPLRDWKDFHGRRAEDEVENVFFENAPVQQMEGTLFWRIISASDNPSSAVLMAPAMVMNVFPPASR